MSLEYSPNFEVAHLAHLPPYIGGAGLMAMQIGKDQALSGNRVSFFGYNGMKIPDEMTQAGVKFFAPQDEQYGILKGSIGLSLPGAIYRAAESGEISPNVIHAHYTTDHLPAALLASQMIENGIKSGRITHMARAPAVVATMHGTDVTVNGRMPEIGPTLEHYLSQVDGLSFVSKRLQSDAEEIFSTLPQYGEVIYNYIDDAVFNPSRREDGLKLKEALGIPQDSFVFYHVSNMLGVKRPEFAIEAYAQASSMLPKNTYFVMVGGEAEGLAAAKRYALERGIGKEMLFVGKKTPDEVAVYAGAADCLILPSREESFGLVNLEAMAVKNAVIATNVGGIPEVVRDNFTGHLVDAHDPEDMAAKMKIVAQNPPHRDILGINGYNRWSSLFSPEPILSKYADLYARAMSKKPVLTGKTLRAM